MIACVICEVIPAMIGDAFCEFCFEDLEEAAANATPEAVATKAA